MPWTTRAEIESIWSTLGVTLRVDDDGDNANSPTETAMLDDVIDEATETARSYLMHRYSDSEMDASPWVRRRVSYLAAHYLSTRRGNPAQFTDKADKILEELKAVREGRDFVPDARPAADFTPAGSNLSIDYRFYRPKVRVDPSTSTGGTAGNRDWDNLPPTVEPY